MHRSTHMPTRDSAHSGRWLDLSDAARYLGVHFTTLRRWADAGQVPCIRTPGGRRRFAEAELETFLEGLREGPRPDATGGRALVPLESRTLDVARRHLHEGAGRGAPWESRF